MKLNTRIPRYPLVALPEVEDNSQVTLVGDIAGVKVIVDHEVVCKTSDPSLTAICPQDKMTSYDWTLGQFRPYWDSKAGGPVGQPAVAVASAAAERITQGESL